MIHVTRMHCEMPYLPMIGPGDGLNPEVMQAIQRGGNVRAASNSAIMARDFGDSMGCECVYLPSIYPLVPRRVLRPDPDVDNVVCFGRIFSLKNMGCQAVAALRFARERGHRLRFHVNGTTDHGDAPILQTLRMLLNQRDSELVTHGWMSKVELFTFLETMTVGLQVSFSEASNVMAMDMASVGIPMVLSREIKWADPMCTAYPTDTMEIFRKMIVAVQFPQFIDSHRFSIQAHNEGCWTHWQRFLGHGTGATKVLVFYHSTGGQETGISNAAMNDVTMLREHGVDATAVATNFNRTHVAGYLQRREYTHVIYEASFASLAYAEAA